MPRPGCRALLLGACLLLASTPEARSALAPHVPGELIIKYRAGATAAQRQAVPASLGATALRQFPFIDASLVRFEDVDLDVETAIERLRSDPSVEYAEPNYTIQLDRTPSDSLFSQLWGMENTGQTGGTPGAHIHATRAWDLYTGNPDVLVGVIDTGVDYLHPDLAPNCWVNPGEIAGNRVDDDGNGYVDDVHGFSFDESSPTTDPRDDHGHGTHVSGTIAAVADNRIGVAGVTWHAKIVAIKFLSSGGSGSMAGAVASIQYAMRVGVQVMNASWGADVQSLSLLDALRAAEAAGMLLVAAAGNTGLDGDRFRHYPSGYPLESIVSVAATDHDDALATFSTYGATSVDLAAPGVRVLSTFAGGGYRSASGTSMAAPHVTGAVALILGRYPGMQSRIAKDVVLRTAQSLPQLQGKTLTGGRLNLFAAISELVSGADTLAPGPIGDLRVVATRSTSLDLAWTATGDDDADGRALHYELRYATHPIDEASFASAHRAAAPAPSPAGSPEQVALDGLAYNTVYWIAVRALDEFGNRGPISNVVTTQTLGVPRLGLSFDSLYAEVPHGTQAERTLTLRNDGQGILEYTIGDLVPVPDRPWLETVSSANSAWFAASSESPTAAAEAVPSPIDLAWRGEPGGSPVDGDAAQPPSGDRVPPWLDPSWTPEEGPGSEPAPPIAAVAMDGPFRGGPDGGGYYWTDSEHGGPPYEWVDITQVGTAIELVSTEYEYYSDSISIGFSFPFYGTEYTRLRVSHGYVLLGDVPLSASRPNRMLPDGTMGPMIGPFWCRIWRPPGPRIYVHNDGSRFVVTWQPVPSYAGGKSMAYQLLIYPNGEIRCQYARMLKETFWSELPNHTVGIQNGAGLALMADYNTQDLVKDDLCLQFVRLPRWATPSVTRGQLAAGESVDIRLQLDAASFAGGTVRGRLPLSTNDPVPVSDVRLQLHARGTPRVFLDRDRIDLPSMLDGATMVQRLKVFNTGDDDLHVTAISTSGPEVTVDRTAFRLPPLTGIYVTVRIAPHGTGAFRGSLTIASDDPAGAVRAVPIETTVLPAPGIALDRPVIASQMSEARPDTQRVRLRNTGPGPLAFSLRSLIGDVSAPVPERISGVPQPADVAAAPRAPVAAGGPDGFGYTWRTSDEPGGPTFEWVDISFTGAPAMGLLRGSLGRIACGIPIGFAFPYYGQLYTTVDVSGYGWLSPAPMMRCDGSAPPAWGENAPLPGGARSPTMIAPFWEFLTPLLCGFTYTLNDGERFIVSWIDLVREARYGIGGNDPAYWQEFGPYTFQAILYPSGRIVFQYQRMYPYLLSATVGLAGTGGGLQVAFNEPFVRNGLAVEFLPTRRWVHAYPDSGTIPPGGAVDVMVAIDPAGLPTGTHHSTIEIRTDDPNAPDVRLPVLLNLGVQPVAAAAKQNLEFGTVFLGQARQETLRVTNQGAGLLLLDHATVQGEGFTLVAASVPAELARWLSTDLIVRFSPTAGCESCAGLLEIGTNDPARPKLEIPLTARAVPPPRLEVAADTVRAALAWTLGPAAATGRRTVTIRNPSPTPMQVSGGLAPEREPPALVAAGPLLASPAAPVAGADAARAARPMGQGGDHGFGYRWKDSDAPGGPAFRWQDITLIGRALPITGDDDVSEPIEIGFAFPYYGRTFTTVRASTNGWLTFGESTPWNFNRPLPAEYAPPDMVAPFWDNLSFGDRRRAYVYTDGQRCIVSWVEVTDHRGKGSRTFQVILEAGGRMVFQYLTVNGLAGSTTVGIQNGARDDALQIAFDQPYLHDSLAIEIARPPHWVRVVPDAITVPGNGEARLELAFDATGLADGTWRADLDLSTNDPARPEHSVPCVLQVGAREGGLELVPEQLNAGSRGRWTRARIEPPPGGDAAAIAVASVRLAGVPIVEGAPLQVVDGDGDGIAELDARFDRVALLGALTAGDSVAVEAIGEIAGVTWFRATDWLRVRRPQVEARDLDLAAGASLAPDAAVTLAWRDPAGPPAGTYDLWYSPDDGTSWTLAAGGLRGHAHRWQAPSAATGAGRLELVARDAQGIELGSWLSGPLVIAGTTAATVPLPSRFGLRLVGANPAGRARLELAVARRGPVTLRIHDVRGARVRTLLAESLEPGWRILEWDGRDATGHAAAAGVYFATLEAEGRRHTTRLVLLR